VWVDRRGGGRGRSDRLSCLVVHKDELWTSSACFASLDGKHRN
jgi:hypothetical protein